MPLLRALRQITGYSRGDTFITDDRHAAELLRKIPAIVELVSQAVPARTIPPIPQAKAQAQPITSDKLKKK